MAYMNTYRRGMHQQYGTSLREALSSGSQQAALTGRSLSPEEVTAIAQGVLTPYLAPYSSGLREAHEMDLAQNRYDKELKLAKQQLNQAEEAAQISGISQFGQLGLLGALTFGGGSGPAAAGAAAATAPATASAIMESGGTIGAIQAPTGVAASGWGTAFSQVGGPAAVGGLVGGAAGQMLLGSTLGKTGGTLTGGAVGGAAVGTVILPGPGTLVGAGVGAASSLLADPGTYKAAGSFAKKAAKKFKKAFKKPW